MTFKQVSEIAQFMGSIAVVASLLFVGVQLRQTAKSTRASSHHAVSEALNQINLLWAENGEVTRIWLLGMEDRNALTLNERWRFDSTLRAYLHVCETMFWQAELGAGDADIVIAEADGIKFVFSHPGARSWWVENRFGFSPVFRDYIQQIASPS